MELTHDDCKSLFSQLKNQEKQLRLKRRWLMGLHLSKCEQKKLEGPVFQNDRIIPESLLREDDVYYDTIKAIVGKGFGACNIERGHHVVQDNNMQLFDLPDDIRNLFSLLDDMTNTELCHFTEILTGGSINFEKTRSKMKKIIKECLPKVLMNRNDKHHVNISKQLSQLLKDPHNIRENCATLVTPLSQSYHAAAIKVLDGLEDLPTLTLSAMHRKLRGIQGYMPQLQPPKSGWGRDILIARLREICMKMLSKLDEGDPLQESLSKAMAVAGLTLTQILGCHSVTFHQFSPDIEVLHDEISKAIRLLNKVRFPELKNLQLLLDANTELSNRRLRSAVRNLLIEYLFECSDMDTIPKCLLETLALINKRSPAVPFRYYSKELIKKKRRYYSKEKMEKEVECVLSVSAQTKQILWDLLPEHELDQEFAYAYMEDLEESDDGDGDGDGDGDDDEEQQVELQKNSRFYSNDSDDEMESIGETNLTNFKSPTSTTKEDGTSPVLTPNRRLNSKLESMHITEMESVDSYGSASSPSFLERKILDSQQSMGRNQYQLGTEGNLGLNESQFHALTDNQVDSSSPFSLGRRSNENDVVKQEPTIDLVKPPDFVSSNFSRGEANFTHDTQGMSRNRYLAIQDASDETSIVAYRLIGRILEEFAQIEGLELDWGDVSYLRGNDSIPKGFQAAKEERTSCEEDVCGSVIIQALEELMPSFPKSGKESVKKLMGLK